MNRILLAVMACSTALGISAQSVDEMKQSEKQPRNGFHFGMLAGGSFGDVKGNVSDVGRVIFQGSNINISFQLGYAYKDWVAGFAFGVLSKTVSSVQMGDTSYKVDSKYGLTIDHTLNGIFVKRYFSAIDVFVFGEVGIGKFTISTTNPQNSNSTQKGYAWNIGAGKEFRIGKRKRLGLGGYINVCGLSCYDVAPYTSDLYHVVSPGLGVVFTFQQGSQQ